MRDDIQHILSGKSQVKHHHLIQTTCSYLKGSQGASSMAKDQQQHKEEETKSLIQFAEKNHLWVDIDIDLYVSQGAEQKVYLKNGLTVLKLNDAIYYASWVDYFHNLLLNNLFFPDTAFQLLGFYKDSSILYAVVEQPFVKELTSTDLRQRIYNDQENMIEEALTPFGIVDDGHDVFEEQPVIAVQQNNDNWLLN